MSSQSSIPWFDDFIGVAYRYYDLRMNVIPLLSDRKQSTSLWHDTIHWWVDPSIKIRFVETGDKYWFIMGSDSQKPDTNLSFLHHQVIFLHILLTEDMLLLHDLS